MGLRFDKQIDEPVDIVAVADLSLRYTALNFLFPDDPPPIFKNDLEAVSREAADKVAGLFMGRGIERTKAQRFVLQLVVAMFGEDIGLLPSGTVLRLANDCLHKGQSSYDLFGGLFTQMNTSTPATGGRFKNVPYFNGGVFQIVEPIDLTEGELLLICQSAYKTDPRWVWAPWGEQESGGCFDRRPGIAILELLLAEIAQR